MEEEKGVNTEKGKRGNTRNRGCDIVWLEVCGSRKQGHW